MSPQAPIAGPTIMDLQDALVAWASAALPGVSVIWADQPGTRPTRPFVTLNLKGPIKVTGIDWREQGGLAVGGSRRYVVSVQTYTNPPVRAVPADPGDPDADPVVPPTPAVAEVKDAAQLASDLVDALDDPYLSDDLNVAGIGIGPVSAPQDLSALLDTKFERRIAFDFEINVQSARVLGEQASTETIESVPTPTSTLSH